MIWLCVISFICYGTLIIVFSYGVFNVAEFTQEEQSKKMSFSVVIPFRDEAKNLPSLLRSIANLNYPKDLVEFILVDDSSTDTSLEVIDDWVLKKKQLNMCVIANKRVSGSPKKDAITSAISKAKHHWIVTTDADCLLPENWLSTLDAFIQKKNPKMVVAPVMYKTKDNFLEQFQLLDFLSMQGTTVGSFGVAFPFLCNGANLAYDKEVFLELKGFNGNDTIASGDDIFLLEKFIKADKKNIHYLKSKEVVVTTFPAKKWEELINQRTRWAAKTSKFNSIKVKLVGILVLVVNLWIVTFLCLGNLKAMFLSLFLKMIIDLCLLLPTARFFNIEKKTVKWYFLASLVYPFFNVIIVLKSLFFRYNWKGRRFKK